MFFSDLKDSISNISSYKRFSSYPGSKPFKYIFLLLTFLFIVKYSIGFFQFQQVVQEGSNFILKDIPNFKLENGEFSLEGETPFVMEEDGFYIRIDPNTPADTSLLDNKVGGIVIDKHSLISKNNNKIEQIKFSDFGSFSFSRDTLISWIEKADSLYFIFGIPWFIGYLIRHFWAIFILTIIGLIINSILETNKPFESLWNIGSYANTLPILLLVGLQIINAFPNTYFYIPVFPFFLVRWAIAIIFIYLALKNIKQNPSIEKEAI